MPFKVLLLITMRAIALSPYNKKMGIAFLTQ